MASSLAQQALIVSRGLVPQEPCLDAFIRLRVIYPGKEHHWPSEAHIGGVVQGYLNLAYGKAEASELSEIQALSVALSNWCDQWAAVLPAAMVSIRRDARASRISYSW